MLRFTQRDSPLTADRDRVVRAQPSSPTQQDGSIEGGEPPRGLRTALLIGFGGLLVIMLVAGSTALQTLRRCQ